MGNNNAEVIICKSIGKILVTSYNWSLLLTTLIIWSITGLIDPYSTNQNFDIVTSLSKYIQFLSITAITYGLIRQGAFMTKRLLRMGIVTYVLSWFTMMLMKSFGILFHLGIWFVKPLTIFSFLLLVKNMWLIPSIQKKEHS